MATLFSGLNKEDLQDHVLVLCAVSVGNVGQLTLDLLTNNLRDCKKIGRVFHPGLEPVVGNEISESGQLSLLTTCQVYRDASKNIVILQFHAPVLAHEAKNFSEYLASWIETNKFSQVICVSTTYASERVDVQIQDRPFRFLTTSTVPESSRELLARGSWKELERRSFPAPPVYERGNSGITAPGAEHHIPGSGITKELLAVCETRNIACTALLMFVSEGDNTQDAKDYFKACNQLFQWVSCDESTLNIPLSWNCMYGTDFPQEIY